MIPPPMEPCTMTDASTILLLVASVVVMAGFSLDNLLVRSRRNG
jgi:hypothetical protein